MSFDLSIGLIADLSRQAWEVYRSCKEAPKDFQDISGEVCRLHIVLKETDEIIASAELAADEVTAQRLKILSDGCREVLTDLEALLSKFQSLGTQAKRTFDRLRWAQDDVVALRARIVSNTALLATFNTSLQM
jgi:hypothetical protein